MDATVILIDSEDELARARALVAYLVDSDDAGDLARLEAQARLIGAYESQRWPARLPTPASVIEHLMDQHGLSRADMIPLLGTLSRVSEVLAGNKRLSLAMIQRLRKRFHIPAGLLLEAPSRPAGRVTRSARPPLQSKCRRQAARTCNKL